MYAPNGQRKLSPLYKALRNGDEQKLQLVLREDHDAFFDYSFDYGEPPLVAAINMGCDRNIALTLLKHSADANKWGEHGY